LLPGSYRIKVEAKRSRSVATVPRPPEGGSESFKIEFDQEDDGRWIAEIPELPGVMVYGTSKADAEIKVTVLALRVIADRTEQAKYTGLKPEDL
jgi:predicted RNase H-like HicB family nuclease